MSQVICSALRSRNPEVVIDMLAPRATLSLASRMSEVNKGILIDQGHGQLGLGYRFSLGRQLRANKYDQAIVIPNSLKSALAPFVAEIPIRTGFLGEYRYFLLNDIRQLDKKRLPCMTDRFLALVGREGDELIRPKLLVDENNQQRVLQQHGLSMERPVIGLCPGAAFGDAKKWPEEHYSELARDMIASGHSVWILGSSADEATGTIISNGAGSGCVNLAGRTSLPDVIDLLALCEAVVTNDSGLMHVASAVDTKVVALYGSTSPDFTPPLAKNASILRLALDCSPCFKRECPLGHKDCLRKLMPAQVLKAL